MILSMSEVGLNTWTRMEGPLRTPLMQESPPCHKRRARQEGHWSAQTLNCFSSVNCIRCWTEDNKEVSLSLLLLPTTCGKARLGFSLMPLLCKGLRGCFRN